jgi:bifunctional DNA-binding transcriptional regulator/antitoxin component of YhaV-PrlF toxin-antitoxin module
MLVDVTIESVDEQGRILLPKEWRAQYLKRRKVIIVCKGDVIEIRPFKETDLTKYFDKVEMDLRSDLSDWHKVRKELSSV